MLQPALHEPSHARHVPCMQLHDMPVFAAPADSEYEVQIVSPRNYFLYT